jgi:hypothetical protein
MQDIIGSKTVGGMLAFLSQIVDKGRARDGVIKPLDTSIRKVFGTVAGDGWQSIDIGNLDLDDYMLRFGNMTNGQYTSSSLSVYKSRIRKSLEWYVKFLTTPGWVPPVRESNKDGEQQKAGTAKTTDTTPTKASFENTRTKLDEVAPKAEDGMISYPLPLASGKVTQLYLPIMLTQTDARRISAFVASLAFEESQNNIEPSLDVS